MADHTTPSGLTRAAERAQGGKAHVAGRGPTDDEARAAASITPGPAVAEHTQEMLSRGAHQKGEGRI